MSPWGAGCSAGLLLTVGWLTLLAGLQSAAGTNVTAFQDLSVARAGSEGGVENDSENEGQREAENHGEAETLPQPEAVEDGEGGRLRGDEGTR